MKELSLADTRITGAERVAPGWKFPPSPFNVFLGPNAAATTSFCRVTATIEKEIRIEVWLPNNWNGRYQGVGNGGLSGAINYPALQGAVTTGFAGASTDTGHQTPTEMFDANWVDGHPQRVIDFAHRAHHLMAERAKEIVAAYYGTRAHHNYFMGCSSGGWQGLTEAQRYPNDYDGIVASAPANNFVRLQSHGILAGQLALRDPKAVLRSADLQLIADAATKHCDANDGVTDGLIENPLTCRFNPAVLTCKAGQTEKCLSPEQVQTARLLHGPRISRGGMRLYPGPAWGSPPFPFELNFEGDPMLVRALKARPSWTTATFDPDRDIPPMEAELGPLLNAMNPDLNAFRAAGGKLILWHGWADPVISPYNTLDYWEAMRSITREPDSFARLFMAPGVAHCAGGPGPDQFDAMSAVVDWVEKGRAPASIIASHRSGPMGGPPGPVDRTRPLCPWPKVARYSGSGSIDEAKNFTCADQ
jgi:feruloyl esterase